MSEAEAVTVTGTLVHADHCWEDKLVGKMTHKVRLDDGKLLVVTNQLAAVVTPWESSPEDTLSTLYKQAGEGVGHRLSIDLTYAEGDKTKAVYSNVRDLGLDKQFRDAAFRDQGFFDSLPIISSVRGNTIRSAVAFWAFD